MNNTEFSSTEQEIITMLCMGHTSTSIIEWLGICTNEFTKTKKQIFKKLGVSRIIQVLPAAVKAGIIIL